MNKKTKGYSLVEVMLVLGIIAMLTMAVYNVASKANNSYKVEKQAQLVEQIVVSLDDYLMTVSNTDLGGATASLTTTFADTDLLIRERLIPSEMTEFDGTTNTLKTVWGNTAQFNVIAAGLDITPSDAIPNPVAAYEIQLDGITSLACSILVTHERISRVAQQITVNNNIVRSPGTWDTATTIATNVEDTAGFCSAASNSIKIGITPQKKGIDPLLSSNAAGAIRPKEDKHFISPTATLTNTGATVCVAANGVSATFNATTSSCTCGSGAEWRGDNVGCVTIDSPNINEAGVCALGQRWNMETRVCEALTLNGGSIELCIPGIPITTTIQSLDASVPALTVCEIVNLNVASTGTYQAGRYIPTVVTAAPALRNRLVVPSLPLNAQVTEPTLPNINAAIQPCPTSTRPIGSMASPTQGTPTNPIANYDGKICQMCINGSWDGDRCVTN